MTREDEAAEVIHSWRRPLFCITSSSEQTSGLCCVHHPPNSPKRKKKKTTPKKSGTQLCYEVIGVCPSLIPPPTPWLDPGSIAETRDPFYNSVQKQDGMAEGGGDQPKK